VPVHPKTTVIAEAGVNHNGSPDMALRLVDAAADAGADIVKFQLFHATALVSPDARKADYQKRTTGPDQTQLEMLQKLELQEDDFRRIVRRCRDRRIGFLATPFDEQSLDDLVGKYGAETIKFASGELTNGPLLLRSARTGKSLILSTGMSTLAEVEAALAVLAYGYTTADGSPSQQGFQRAYASENGRQALRTRVTLLHCTTEYPSAYEDANLRAMDTLRETFALPVGLSDHTPGIAIPIAAVARGAVVIEKHLTLDRNLAGPDHRASLEPGELREMVTAIRQIEVALGDGVKVPTAAERKNIPVARKSLVAARDIRKGETFTAENVAIKRPGTGMSPMQYWDWLGRVAAQDYKKDQML
jgi:N-acetylneuraminate synthase